MRQQSDTPRGETQTESRARGGRAGQLSGVAATGPSLGADFASGHGEEPALGRAHTGLSVTVPRGGWDLPLNNSGHTWDCTAPIHSQSHVLVPLECSCRKGRSTSPAVPRRRCSHKGTGAAPASPARLGVCPRAPSCVQHSLTLPHAHTPAPRQEGNGQPAPSWAVGAPSGADRTRPHPCTPPVGTALPPPAGALQCPRCTSSGHRRCTPCPASASCPASVSSTRPTAEGLQAPGSDCALSPSHSRLLPRQQAPAETSLPGRVSGRPRCK